MNRSRKSSQSDADAPRNQAYGTQLPSPPSGGLAHPPSEPSSAESSTPAYQTYSPPQNGGAAPSLPDEQVFSSVYQTSGLLDDGLRTIAQSVQMQIGSDSVKTINLAESRFADSDFVQTVQLPGGTDTPERDYQQTIELPGEGEGGPPRISPSGGKSTWQLQIREKSLKGYVSGVRNRIPTLKDEAEGFLAAFVDNPEVAEYEVLNELGKGNMGIVYEARQSSLNRELAIKSLNPKEGNAQYEQEMFVSEAVVTANLVHPNIVPIHDLGRTDDGKLFYSMKKVTGTSWDKIMRSKSLEENLDIFMKVCDAVAYAHSRGVINRDLKPENVVVGNYGEVIVLDWGLAVTNELFPKQESILLEYRGGAGTPVYMAPELVSDDISSVGNHSDIYLLGAILFEVLEGFPPHLLRSFWEIENPQEQFASIVTAVMTNQIERHVVHPGELMDIAFKAMATQPVDRFRSVEEMQELIRQYRITGHAEEFYQAAASESKNQSYDNYQSSVALFSEALRKWPENQRALHGDRLARKGFAELALHKGDFDLGLHLIETSEGPEFEMIRKKLKRDRRRRAIIKRTWMGLATAIVLLAGFTLMLSQSVASLTEDARIAEDAKDQAKKEQQLAVAEMEKAEEAKKAAEEATIRASELQEIAEKDAKLAEMEKLAAVDAKTMAEMEKIKAEELKKVAEAGLKKTEEQLTSAQEATKKANLDLKKAEVAKVEAENAKVQAEMVLAQAVEAQKKVEESLLDVEWKKFNLQFNLYLTLGQFEEAYDEIKAALAKAELSEDDEGFNAKFKQRKRSILQKARDLQQRRMSQILDIEGDLKSAVVSRDGKVIAFATPTRIEILFTPDSKETSLANLQAVSFDGLKVQVGLEISPDGNFLVATGRDYKRIWSMKNGAPVDYALTDEFQDLAPEKASNYEVARFSPDSSKLLLVSGDDRLTVEIYDLSSGRPEALLRDSLAGNSNNEATIADFFLVPVEGTDAETSQEYDLVYLASKGESSMCKVIDLTFDKGVPAFGKTFDFQDSRPYDFNMKNLRQEEMSRLLVSPSFNRMVIQVGDRFLQIFERSDESVPFKPIQEDAIVVCDSAISSLGFSEDGLRLLVGTRDGFIEVWDWNEESRQYLPYHPGAMETLWRDHRIGGISTSPVCCSFLEGKKDQIVAIGLTDQDQRTSGNSILKWDLNHYSDYTAPIISLAEEIFGKENLDGTNLEPVRDERKFVEVESNEVEETTSEVLSGDFDFSALQTVGFNQADGESADKEEEVVARWPVALFVRSAEEARFSKDGQRIVVAADDRAAHVFARNRATVMITGGRRSRFYEPDRNVFEEGHIPELSQLLFLPPNGSRLMTKDFFGAVSVWDASLDEDGFAREVSRMLTSDFGLAASPDGKWVLASSRDIVQEPNDKGELEDKTLFVARLWNTEDFENDPTPDAIRTFSGKHQRLITAAAISPDSTLAVTADRRGHIVVWDLMSGEVVGEAIGQHGNDQVSGIEFLNENELISSGFDGTIQRWLLNQEKLVRVEDARFMFQRESTFDDYVISLNLAPDRKSFATISVKNGGRVNSVEGKKDMVNLVRLTVWSTDSPREPRDLTSFEIHENSSAFDQGVSWSGDGSRLAHIYPEATLAGNASSELTIYDTKTWNISKKFRPVGLDGVAAKIAFKPNPDGGPEDQIATFDGRVAHLWNLSDGSHLTEFRSHETVFSADFSADRKLVATASDSLRIFIGDELSDNHGSTVFRMTGAHLGRVEEVRFSEQAGSYNFVTLGGDAKVKFWDWNWSPNEASPPPSTPSVTISLEPEKAENSPMWDSTIEWKSSIDLASADNLLVTTFAGELYAFQKGEAGFKRVKLALPEGVNARFNCCAISNDGKMIAAGGARLLENGRTLESFSACWELADDGNAGLLAVFKGKHSPNLSSERVAGTTAICFGPDSLTVLTGGTDGALWEWDWEERDDPSDPVPEGDPFTPYRVNNLPPHGTSTVNSIDVSNTGDILSAGSDGAIAFWPALKVEL